MASNMNQAKELLFGKDGLNATNFRMFPGANREASAEDIAGELVRSLTQLIGQPQQEVEIAD
ncbi:hypothetical protein [Tahibacter caeni]|uniref:hypothetical protein n=1 Tax=Tahibacter caeni TaxID=1453545 RepID=UPI002147965C|nr:hypothetical protein [Tahibacter caeni]